MATQPSNRKTIFAGVIGTGVVLTIISVYYHAGWVEPVATVLLCCITAIYVLFTNEALQVTHEQLELLRRQNERRDRVLLFVDLSYEPPNFRLHIFNLGLSGVLVQKIIAKSSDDIEKPQTFDLHKIVESGKTEPIKLPKDLWEGDGSTDFEFTVHYIGISGPGSTRPKSFNAFSWGRPGDVITITDGLDAMWYASCPKCKVSIPINVAGLKTFEPAQARVRQIEEDLAISYADHKSDWMLTVEKIREVQEGHKNRRKL